MCRLRKSVDPSATYVVDFTRLSELLFTWEMPIIWGHRYPTSSKPKYDFATQYFSSFGSLKFPEWPDSCDGLSYVDRIRMIFLSERAPVRCIWRLWVAIYVRYPAGFLVLHIG